MSTETLQQILQQRFNGHNQSTGGGGDTVTDTEVCITNPTVSDNHRLIASRDWRHVDSIADKLESQFGRQSPSRRPYYCKLGWSLPEGTIWYLAEQAQAGKQPAQLFSWLTSRELAKTAGQTQRRRFDQRRRPSHGHVSTLRGQSCDETRASG